MATGVRQRHGNGCNGKGRCDCPWRAEVYSKRANLGPVVY